MLASYGHVRDLLDKPGSVKTDDNFEMVWSTAAFAGRERGLADIVAVMKVRFLDITQDDKVSSRTWLFCGNTAGFVIRERGLAGVAATSDRLA